MQSEPQEDLFAENFRPISHFTPERNWINDPNGLIYYKGKYHLFFQHNPSGILWGNMSWGHATSEDLLTWNHLPVAIAYNSKFGIFSGSVVVDFKNTSQLGSLENPAMIAIHTANSNDGTHQAQHLAISLDEGLTWEKYENNPVLDEDMKDFRDPKVFWDERSNSWLMVIAKPEEHRITFYSSNDLIKWAHLSDFGPLGATGGCWECPDLFQLTTSSGESKWVLLVSLNPGGVAGGSGTQYFIGQWDGQTFTTDQSETLWIDYGRDNYAGVTFNNAPEGRRIFLGWMSNWDYAAKIPSPLWRGSMTTPRVLSLIDTPTGLRLLSTPIEGPTTVKKRVTVKKGETIKVSSGSQSCSIQFSANTSRLEITRTWIEGVIDTPQLSPEIDQDDLELELFLDNGSCEIFAPAISLAMTTLTFTLLDGLRIETTST